MKRKLSIIISLLASIIVALSLVTSGATATRAAEDPCAAQSSALDQVRSQISAHNAEPHTFIVPEEEAAADAYDAEAAQLNAAQAKARTELENCQETLGALADQGPNSAPIKYPTPYIRNKINKNKAGISPNIEQYKTPDSEAGYWRVPPGAEGLYKTLRANNPGRIGTPYFQGQPRPNIGDPDPPFPGETIIGKKSNPNEPSVTADHIVSIPEIMNLPGFFDLNADNMYIITRAPLNFQWMSIAANESKSSQEVAFMENVDPTWAEEQAALHDSIRSQLEDIIQKMIANQ